QRFGAAFVAVIVKIDVATGLEQPLCGGAADALFRPGDKDLLPARSPIIDSLLVHWFVKH
ncbi:hypothetical protein, partial [Serratia marcescens]|uniref:hypothetical protein n=1 Tax=Serratia marcescens TaxID=615 RepID=UPI00402BB6B7